MEKIIILGAKGYLGSSLFRLLSCSSAHVYAVGRGCSRHEFGARSLDVDLQNSSSLAQINALRPDVIIDCISYLKPNQSHISDKEIYSKLMTFSNLLSGLDSNVKYIFISSGGTVYGSTNRNNRESDNLNPLNCYASQKCVQESLIENSKLRNFYMLRVTNPYGCGQVVKNSVGFITQAINCSLSKMPLTLFVPLNTIRDYIHMQDVLNYITSFINNDFKSGVYNVSTGVGTMLAEVIKCVEENVGEKIEIKIEEANLIGYIKRSVADNSKIIETTGYKPKYNVSDGVFDLVNELGGQYKLKRAQ